MNSKCLSIFISRELICCISVPRKSPRNPNYHKTASEITRHPSQTYRKMIPASDGNCSLFTNPFTACTPSSPNPSQIESECFGYPLISTNSVSSSFSEGDSCSNRLNHLLVAENTISTPPPFLLSPRCHPQQPLLFSTLQWRELLGVNFSSFFLSYLFAVIFFVSPRLF